MLDAGAIEIVGTNKVRGQTENVYAIKQMFVDTENSEDDMKVVTIGLMQILDLYRGYFESGDSDLTRDKLFLFNYAISLNDADYNAMLTKIYKVVDSYLKKTPTEDTKPRNLYMISAPWR